MMDRDDFWKRVQEILDERGDPLEDPAIRDYLLKHPGDLEELVSLGSALRALETSEPAERVLWKRLILSLTAAAVILLCWLWNRTEQERLPAPRGEILDYEIRIVTRTPRGESITVYSPEGARSSVKISSDQPQGEVSMNVSTQRRFSHD